MDDLLRDFLTESNENLLKLDRDIVDLERRPSDRSLLNDIFRTIHTIKGTCGFLALERLEAIAHASESVLVFLREGDLPVTPALISDVLASVDVIKEILTSLEQTEGEPAGDDGPLIARLEGWLTLAPVEAPPALRGKESGPTCGASVATSGASPSIDSTDSKAPVTESSLRVNVVLLDRLMNLVGELVLGRNQLIQLAAGDDDSVFATPVQHLNRVTTDLQEAVMKTRMQPIGSAWTKLPRMVRDLSQANGKQIELEMVGAETELDRQILQAIQDPLTHMVRNSADHGIERPDVRRNAGKPEHGTIKLNAYHEGGHVILEITDDGAGIDVENVRRKAIERGLVSREAGATLPDNQVFRFIFEPGFSTAERITNVSGRGVGMDVVRSNIEKIGGTVDLASRAGHGTTVRIKIPLTLAIISALLVGSGNEVFAIPQIGVVELVRVTEEQRGLIEDIPGARLLRLRDTLLPLVYLDRILSLPEPGERADHCIVVVCQVGELRFGLVVTEVFDTQEIVVKPVSRQIKHLSAYSGCTILGDGQVIMILDTTGIAGMARLTSAADAVQRGQNGVLELQPHIHGERQSLVLFDAGLPALQAVPLSLVARLEEIPVDQLEVADGRVLVQYRGSLLPVVGATPSLDVRARNPRPVIVLADGQRLIGLAVDEIRDITEEIVSERRVGRRPGVASVGVIAGRATEIIDTRHFLREALGEGDHVQPTPRAAVAA